MSWWTRSRGRASARARSRSRRPASRGSCRRRSRTGRRRRLRACATISAGGPARRRGHGEAPDSPSSARAPPRRHAARSRLPRRPGRPSGRGSARARRSGGPASPRARPTLTSAFTVSTPCACCVSPIDQTNMAFGRSISSSRKLADPLARHAARRARCASQPTVSAPARASVEAGRVLARRTLSSMPPRSTSASSTPSRNARSPPVCTSNQWSASAVPQSALSAIDGIQ